MPRVDLTLENPVERTARVVQLEGMFDVPATERSRVSFSFDAPFDERPWSVGLIVGPSGAGKTSVARHLFGDCLVSGYDWHETRSIVDSFEGGIRDTTAALSSVGFSSPPNWLRPFRLLSCGEQFRAMMARALVDPRPRICVDEFTSVVDRTVAQVGSHAIAKSVRKRAKQLVAVTCHYDVEEWLQPDWVIEPHLGRFAWRSLRRRPDLELEVVRAEYSAWRWFAPFHYLSAELHRAARCFVGLIADRPVAFAAFLPFPHPKCRDIRHISRLVVHPDYQGLGLGILMASLTAGICKARGFRVMIVTSHPSLIAAMARSPEWELTRRSSFSARQGRTTTVPCLVKDIRRTATFLFVGSSVDSRLWESEPQQTAGHPAQGDGRDGRGAVETPREERPAP